MEGGLTAQTDGVDEVSSPRPGGAGAPLRAAGGVAVRPAERGAEVLLVHRPRFDDWSLPKGKLKRGEHAVVAAVREVHEETGIRGQVGARLPTVSYDVWAHDELVEKVVDYWTMTVAGQNTFTPGVEVDDLVWLPVDQATARATYPHDKRVLRAFADLPSLLRPVVVLRHTSAGERDEWSDPDAQRPLDPAGVAEAVTLAEVLSCFWPTTLVSAEPLRCQETLAPLARSLGVPVNLDAAFNEGARPEIAAQRVRDLATSDAAVVICSQGDLIPPLVGQLNGQAASRYRTAKGEGWVLSFGPKGLAVVDELPLHTR
jgi:8-oxo-(d)GTP phosphatase